MADRVLVRSLSNVPDHVLIAELRRLLAEQRERLAEVLLHLGEMDARRLHLPAAYPSLFEYCVRELHFSEHEAWARIRAARVVRRYPEALTRLADGRLHLTAITLLAAHLCSDNARELFEAATHRSKMEIQVMLAQRFPQPDVATRVVPVRVAAMAPRVAPMTPRAVEASVTVGAAPVTEPPAPALASAAPADERQLGPARVEFIGVPANLATQEPRAVVTPLAPERFALHCTLLEQEMADLKRAQELLGRAVPAGDAARVIGRALRLLVERLEKPLRGIAEQPATRAPAPPATEKRRVPAEVKRRVWQRDAGRCTFVSASGRRCDSRRDLELDHVLPFARGGRTSVENLRLRCRAHNQFEAERSYGAGFMTEKREANRVGRAPAP